MQLTPVSVIGLAFRENTDVVRKCVMNNAQWYMAVCGAHGSAGELTESMYVNWCETPPFYGNAVCLTPDQHEAQLAIIDRLVASLEPIGDIGIKDSFSTLDLSSRGFEVLFDATWIYRAADVPCVAPQSRAGSELRCERVVGPRALADWEAAWRYDAANTLSPSQPPIFRPELLDDGECVFLSVVDRGQTLAGAIANRHAGVVGLSNTFGTDGSSRDRLATIIAAARVLHDPDGLPLVGYQGRSQLPTFLELGFEAVGPLRVWLKKA